MKLFSSLRNRIIMTVMLMIETMRYFLVVVDLTTSTAER